MGAGKVEVPAQSPVPTHVQVQKEQQEELETVVVGMTDSVLGIAYGRKMRWEHINKHD